MQYTLTVPQTVGDLTHPIVIDVLEIASISLNFSPERVLAGTVILSVVLVHKASGYKVTVTYEDATAGTFWNTVNSGNQLVGRVFTKLIADGKLPAGSAA